MSVSMQREQKDQEEGQDQGQNQTPTARDTPYQQARIPISGIPAVFGGDGSSFSQFDMTQLQMPPHGQHVLGSNEEDFMNAFWTDPESTPQEFIPPTYGLFDFGNLSEKAGLNGHILAGGSFDGSTISPAATTLGPTQTSLQKTHANSVSNNTPLHHLNHDFDNQQLSTDVYDAANLINSMKATPQQQQHQLQPQIHQQQPPPPSQQQQQQQQQPYFTSLPPGSFVGSWGNLAMPNTMPQNQMNFGYYQSNMTAQQSFTHQAGPYGNFLLQHPMLSHDLQPQVRAQPRHMSSSNSTPFYTNSHHSQPWAGSQSTPSHLTHSHARQIPVQFGSDPHFGDRHYQGAPHSTPQMDKDGNLLGIPLAGEASAANGQRQPSNRQQNGVPSQGLTSNSNASSPGGMVSPASGQNAMSWGGMQMGGAFQNNGVAATQELPSRKRRKSQSQREEEEEYSPNGQAGGSKRGPRVSKAEDSDEDASPRASNKRRKSTNTRAQQESNSPGADAEDDGTPGTRRKQRGGGKKENLSEYQKRLNHIASEKKRREIIAQGFADLNVLVPCLALGKSGLSRSEVLQEIGSYLETITEGTNKLMSLIGMTDADDAAAAAGASASGMVLKTEDGGS